MLTVNLVVSYGCNFRCHYCYWTKEQLANHKRIDIKAIAKRLDELPEIGLIDIYGGELAILPEDYMYEVLSLAYLKAKKVNIVSNASLMPSWLYMPGLSIGFSWDYKCREDYELVYQNLKNFPLPFSINTVVTKCVIRQNLTEIIERLNDLKYLKCWELKPYSPSLANDLKVTNKEFEEMVKAVIKNRQLLRKDIIFHNEDMQLKNAHKGIPNPNILADNIFILPSGNFGDFGYKESHLEQFFEFDSYSKWVEWKDKRRDIIRKNPYCSNCNYLGKCMSENMRDVKHMEDSCDGFIELINWHKEYALL